MSSSVTPTPSPPIKGILRRPSTGGRTPTGESPRGLGSPSRVGVHFEPPEDLDNLLQNAADQTLTSEQLDKLLTSALTTATSGPALVAWLQKVQENLSVLKPSLESFVMAILKIAWADQDRAVVVAYRNFLVNLISAQTYYTKPVIKMLMSNLLGSSFANSEQEVNSFDNIHEAIRAVVATSPLASRHAIMVYGKSCLPYILTKDSKSHTNYIANLLKITTYLQEDRVAIFQLIIDRLVQLDAHLPIGQDLDEVDDDDDDEEEGDSDAGSNSNGSAAATVDKLAIAKENLDGGMEAFFNFIKTTAEVDGDENSLKSLYSDLLKVFDTHIMPSYATGHVQFLMFYIVSLNPSQFTTRFCEWLWKLFTNPNAAITRQSAVAYIASFIARAKFVDVAYLRMFLRRLSNWVHQYLNTRSDSGTDYSYIDLRAHGPFYAACQAVLYLLAFRHEELVNGKKSLAFLASLGLGRMVTCSLNPLKVCLPPVVKNFASIARHYQLAYCDTVIERNNRLNLPVVGSLASASVDDAKPLLLDTLFPFDPYRLVKSKHFIAENYREYQGALEDVEEEEEEDDNEESESESDEDEADKEMAEMEAMLKTPATKRRRLDSSGSLHEFMYGMSPGFKS